MDSKPIYLSKEGRIKLEKELKHLKTKERPRLVAEIKRTMELGDLSENAEYHAAKESQQYVERKIAELEDKLSRVRSIDMDDIPTDKAYIRMMRKSSTLWRRRRKSILTMISFRSSRRLGRLCSARP